jgi:predicted nucleic acid-binding protein
MYTLDTNAIIYYLNGDRTVMQTLEEIIDQGAPRYVSTITVLELFSRRGLSELEKDDIERILGLSPEASAVEINAAWKRLMRRMHPDTGGTDGMAMLLNEARHVLMRRVR